MRCPRARGAGSHTLPSAAVAGSLHSRTRVGDNRMRRASRAPLAFRGAHAGPSVMSVDTSLRRPWTCGTPSTSPAGTKCVTLATLTSSLSWTEYTSNEWRGNRRATLRDSRSRGAPHAPSARPRSPATTLRFAQYATTAIRTRRLRRQPPHGGGFASSRRRRLRQAIDILGFGKTGSPSHEPMKTTREAPAHRCRHHPPTPTTTPTATARLRHSTAPATASPQRQRLSHSTRGDGTTGYIRWGRARARRRTTIGAQAPSSLATTGESGDRGYPPCWNTVGHTTGTSSAPAGGGAPTRIGRAA